MARRIAAVFGASGFLGRHLVRRLAAAGYGVRAAGRDPERAQFLKPMGDVGQVVPWPADVTRPDSVAAAVKGADVVVNLVGILYERGRTSFRKVHAEGAGNVARAAAQAGAARLVHVSALGADANSPAEYARTKAAGEDAVKAAFPKATILRPSVVFGPEDDFFNRFASMARLSPALPVIGANAFTDGGPRFQPVYVGDVADAIMAALDDPKAQGQTFELGGPAVYTFRQVMQLVMAQTGRKRCLVPVPYWAAEIQGAVLGLLPVPPLTTDQVQLLRSDNVVGDKARTFKNLGITPRAAEAILPTYLMRFRTNAWHGAQNS
ncbi:MAG: complex I NDUFA9 subunit family protein [Rhodospirillales bacterium CG15_BIG_FIL_POST_REV_8_21_14_020_66_15]|nr:MAG: complex I NDUFA9 subunit family protein [Rhodospirillales bacterium CG15_BIG_FIL_POST_REV_8_21_14_020_66_15]